MRRDERRDARPVKDLVPMSGRLLAKLPRGRSEDGVEQEMRISVDEYSGSKFVRMTIWALSIDGWMPLKGKSATIRRGELADVQAALREAAAEMGGAPARRPDGPNAAPARPVAPRQEARRSEPGRERRVEGTARPPWEGSPTSAAPGGAGFSELDDEGETR